ncbi:FAD:protein FMN transferase [Rhodococcus pyridinivorans]|uniref:FAD:protein FMN transferase n=1 Tax=Rhodococcus pyridinivorans TaxID=103816 RepID=UPI0034338CCB
MIGSNEWWEWGRQIALAVTEPHALHRARMIVRGVVAESEAVSDSRRGDAEIHSVNLAQGTPVTMSPRLASMVRSALWAARMTGGTITPVDSDDASVDAGAIPPIHPIPTYRDVQIDGDIVLAPFGVSLELGATAVADTVDYSAALVANLLECGALVRIGDVMATAGHAPAGGWQVPLPDRGSVELPAGSAMASHTSDVADPERWRLVSVIAPDAVWAHAAAATALQRGIGALSWLEQYALPARLVDTHGRVRTTTAWSDPKAA